MTVEGWIRVGVLVWLFTLALWDLKRGQMPHWGTTVPLLVLGVLRVGYPPAPEGTAFWLARGAMLLLLAGVVLSDSSVLLSLLSFSALILAFQAGPEMVVLALTWIVALLWARWGIWGAGDAKVLMILVGLWPDPYLVGAVFFATLVGGVIALVRRYGSLKVAGVALWQTVCDLRRLNVPARQDADQAASWTRQPGVPWLFLGTVCYLVLGRML